MVASMNSGQSVSRSVILNECAYRYSQVTTVERGKTSQHDQGNHTEEDVHANKVALEHKQNKQ